MDHSLNPYGLNISHVELLLTPFGLKPRLFFKSVWFKDIKHGSFFKSLSLKYIKRGLLLKSLLLKM